MSQYGSYGQRRSEMRQKKKNTWLNGAIILVVIGIVFFAATLIFGNDDTEPVTADGDDQEESDQDSETTEESNDVDLEETSEGTEEEGETGSSDVDSENGTEEVDSTEEDNNTNELTTPAEVVGEGQWEPIGTVQEEPFVAVYERDHVNWEEMLRALKYATGLGEEMIAWRIENGGDHLSAIGFVSDYPNRTTPYEVRLEWVTNEGWKPVSVKLLEENPYLNN
ncbi:MAG: YrrS family protein [Bacillus sp. (in: Bacteria)]|nr:YrrS family protein [Bacillus sp. (in: firmicutes)]